MAFKVTALGSTLVSLACLSACGASELASDSSAGLPAAPAATAPSPPATDSAPPFQYSWTFSRGTRPAGEGCAFGPQCATGVCSADASAGTCGRCLEVSDLGEPCDGVSRGCRPSARCEAGVCTSLRKTAGEACALGPKGDDRDECDFEFHCDGEPGSSHGVCAPRLHLGAACEIPYGASPCLPGDVCDEGVCIANLPAGAGDWCFHRSCQEGLECQTSSGSGYACGPGLLPPGVPCGLVDGSFVDGACAPGTVCGNLDWPSGGGGPGTTSTCVPLPLEGAPCVRDRCTAGLSCHVLLETPGEPHRCERARELGEACSRNFYAGVDCAAGLECRQGVCALACP